MHNANTPQSNPNQETPPASGASLLGRLFGRNRKVPVDQTHHDAMLKNLEHRLQVARDKGDQQLITLLEAELKQLS